MSKGIKKIYLIILAVCICAPVLLIPVFNKQNYFDILKYDKKTPMSLTDIKTDNTFSSSLETYFNEHLPFRHRVISMWANALYALNISVKPDSVVVGQNGWLFLGNFYYRDFDLYRGLLTDTDDEIERAAVSIIALKEYCTNRNIDFLYAVPPGKGAIYPEYYPTWYSESRTDTPRFWVKLMERLSSLDSTSYMVYLEDVLLDSKQSYGDYLYYKSDSHWTTLGSYCGYSAIMDKLIETYGSKYQKINLEGYKLSSSKQTDLNQILGIDVAVGDYSITTSFQPSVVVPAEAVTPDLMKYENDEALTDKTILCFSDSFMDNMLPYLTNTFQKVYVIHVNSALPSWCIETFYSTIDACSPDLILLETIERNIKQLLMWMPTEF